MYKCDQCGEIFEETGTKKTVDWLEFWGAMVPHEEYWDCCPECGSEDFEEYEEEEE